MKMYIEPTIGLLFMALIIIHAAAIKDNWLLAVSVVGFAIWIADLIVIIRNRRKP